MAHKRSQRMAIVLQLAEREEQKAAEQLGVGREQLGACEQQMGQLQEYQEEYTAQINARSGPQNVQQMMADRSFIGQLGDAVDAQKQKIVQAQQQYQQLMALWQRAYRKRTSLEEFISKMRDSESLEADKRLQKELDELSSLKLQRKSQF